MAKPSLVRGKPRHPQSQGSVERANGDFKDMLVAWLAGNNSLNWTYDSQQNVSEPTEPDQQDSSEPTADQYLNDHTAKIENCRADAYVAQVSQADWVVKQIRLN